MKKFLAFVLTIIMLLSVVPLGAIAVSAAETSGTTGDCTWTLDGTVLTISGNGKMEDYDGYYYYESAPWGKGITEVIIEEGVTCIGEDAFYGCSDLKSITIPSTVTHIDYAFYSCDAIESLYISDMVAWCNIDFETSPLNYSYHGGNLYLNGELVENLEIPECITRLPAYVFGGCASLKTVTIHDKLTSIGDEAFAGCLNLKSVTLSEGLTTIGYRAFYNCNGFATITLPDSVTSIGGEAFYGCYGLITVTIPEKVTSIGAKAFASCPSLTRVNLPKSLNNIGGYIFRDSPYAYGCCYKNSFAGEYLKSNNYEAVYIDDTVENVICNGKVGKFNWSLDKRTGVLKISGDGRLIDFTNVEAPWIKYSNYITCVEFEGNITYISERAFITCYAIYEIDIPDSVTEIGKFAFYSCKGIRKIIIPEGVVTIGSSAFYYCENLESVYLPTTLKTINDSAFNYCYKLEAVYVPDIYTWFNIQFNKKTGYVTNPLDYAGNLYINGKLLEDLVIPEGITTIPAGALSECTSLKTLVIPDTVTKIDNAAFMNCSNLKAVTIGNGVEYIWSSAFSGCKNLISITIPYNVINIDKNVFYGCDNLKEVTIFNKDCYLNANCGLNYKQTLCGHTVSTTEALAETVGASFVDITETHKTHDFVQATCAKPKQCKLCGAFEGEALEHIYDDVCDAECNICNISRIALHLYDNDCDTDCNVCGETRKVPDHTYKKYKTTDATTSKDGKKYYKCSVCGKTKTSTIYKASKVYLSTEEYTYNGKTKKPSVKVYDSKGKKLDYGDDYTYSRPSSSKKVGKYKIKVTFKGDYTGSKTLYYTINPKATKVSSVTAAKKSLKVKISKQSSQTTGYQIQYSTSSKFKSAKTKTISSYKTTSYTIKSLSAKKYYYVRVRTYKTVNGTKYYSDWSKSVKKKTK